MITEDYVSFETAKLLKEKGFDEECRAFWKEWDKQIILCHCSSSHVFEWCHNSMLETYYNDESELNVATPTLQMTMKWLREVHNIAISVYVFNRYLPIEANDITYTCDIATISTAPNDGYLKLSGSYEEVCEAAIKYCLENLI